MAGESTDECPYEGVRVRVRVRARARGRACIAGGQRRPGVEVLRGGPGPERQGVARGIRVSLPFQRPRFRQFASAKTTIVSCVLEARVHVFASVAVSTCSLLKSLFDNATGVCEINTLFDSGVLLSALWIHP